MGPRAVQFIAADMLLSMRDQLPEDHAQRDNLTSLAAMLREAGHAMDPLQQRHDHSLGLHDQPLRAGARHYYTARTPDWQRLLSYWGESADKAKAACAEHKEQHE